MKVQSTSKFQKKKKNSTSRLQPLDAGIIGNSKLKYRKLLLRFVVSRVNDSQTASQIIEDEVHIFRVISWLQTTWKSVTLEIIKNCFRKCGFDAENNCEVINDQIDAEFWELFDQVSSGTDIDEYIGFGIEVVTSLPAINPLMVDWRQETSDAAAKEANQSEEEQEIVPDQDENRKITSPETLKKLNEVKNFIEVNESDLLNMIFNELIENAEQRKLKNQKQSDIISFFSS